MLTVVMRCLIGSGMGRVQGVACSVSGCDKLERARGLCTTHYRRLQRGTDLEAPLERREGDLVQVPGAKLKKKDFERLKRLASSEDLSVYAYVVKILEEFIAKKSR